MSDEDMFERHINPGGEFKIGNDTFKLKPLEYRDLPKFWKLVKKMSTVKVDKDMDDEAYAEAFMAALDDDMVETILHLCQRTMEISYPNISPDKREAFVKDNFITMLGPLTEINTPQTDDAKRKLKHLKKDESKAKSKEAPGQEAKDS